MYIEPFWAGVCTGIIVGALLIILPAVIHGKRNKGEK